MWRRKTIGSYLDSQLPNFERVAGFYLMKKPNGTTLKIMAASSMVFFSLAAAVLGTLAWFTGIRKKDSAGDDFVVSARSGRFKQVTFHTLDKKVIGNTYSQSTFSFEKDYIGKITYNWVSKTMDKEGDTNLVFDNYDYLEHEQPILLLFEFDKEYSADDKIIISAKASDDTNFFLGERNSDGENIYSLDDEDVIVRTISNQNYYAMSSAVCFYSRGFSTSSYDSSFGQIYNEEPESDLKSNVSQALSCDMPQWNEEQNHWRIDFSANRNAASAASYYGNLISGISGFSCVLEPQEIDGNIETVYASSTAYVKISAAPDTNTSSSIKVTMGLGSPFFTFTNLTSQKSFVDMSQQPESDFDQIIDPLFESNSATKYVAVIIDYFSDAIEYIYSSFLGDSTLESYDSILRFICDWQMEVI